MYKLTLGIVFQSDVPQSLTIRQRCFCNYAGEDKKMYSFAASPLIASSRARMASQLRKGRSRLRRAHARIKARGSQMRQDSVQQLQHLRFRMQVLLNIQLLHLNALLVEHECACIRGAHRALVEQRVILNHFNLWPLWQKGRR